MPHRAANYSRQDDPTGALSPLQLEQLLAYAPAAIAVLGHRGVVISLSGSFTRIFGYTIEDIPHIDAWWALAYPDPTYREDRRSVWMSLMQAAVSLGGEIHNFEGNVRCKDGHRVWVEAHASASATEFFILLVDISSRKGLEDERRRTAWLDLALASGNAGLWEWQPDADIHSWSQATHRLFGMEDQPPSFLAWEQRIHPDDRGATLEAIRAAVVSCRPFETDYRLQIPGGSLRWLRVRGNPVSADAGPMRYLGIVLDITDERAAAEQLRIQAQIFEQSPNAVIVTDADMTIRDVNPAFSRIHGYAADEVIGRQAGMLGGATTPPETIQSLAAAVSAGEVWEGDFHNRRKDGRIVIDQCRVFPVRDADGGVTHFVGIQTDVTEVRCQAEELERYRRNLEAQVEARTRELRMAEQKYRTIADHTYDWETWIDPSGEYLYCSPSCQRITGHPPSDFMVDPDLMLRIAHPDDAERVLAHYAEHDGGDCGERKMEFRIIDAAGQEHWLEHLCRPVRDDAGRPLGFRGSNRDITERKLAEAEREAARQAAERLSRMKSDFLANMSHEVRTPLNGVLGLAQVGFRQSAGRSSARETFGRILESGQLLLTVINDILDFSKIEAGKMAIEEIPYTPADTTQQALESVAQTAAAKGLKTTIVAAADLPASCLGDPMRIKQILLNLLSNAIKFSEAGTIRIAVQWRAGHLVYSVTDDGVGIMPDIRERLFQPFEQGDSSTTRRYGGTGLGLAISARLAHLMGGTLTVASTPGTGSCFGVRSKVLVIIRLSNNQAANLFQ